MTLGHLFFRSACSIGQSDLFCKPEFYQVNPARFTSHSAHALSELPYPHKCPHAFN